MLIGKCKMKKYNYFDILDAEFLEEYLSEKAQNGWMIKKISAMYLTFEKIEPKLINFFVDNTKHEMVKDQYALKSDYVNLYKENNLEYICGNETFQIFINNSETKNFPRQELKFRNIFKEYYYFIFGLIILAINIYNIFNWRWINSFANKYEHHIFCYFIYITYNFKCYFFYY